MFSGPCDLHRYSGEISTFPGLFKDPHIKFSRNLQRAEFKDAPKNVLKPLKDKDKEACNKPTSETGIFSNISSL